MAQVAHNPREVALNGNVRRRAGRAVVRAMQSHQVLAEHVLPQDKQALEPLVGLIYELLKSPVATSTSRIRPDPQVTSRVGLG